MSRRWLDDRTEKAFTTAVAQIEGASGVELAISIRRSARSWPHMPFIAGAVGVWATLAFMLFSEPTFGLESFLLDPFLAGLAVAWGVTVGTPARWRTLATARRRAVAAAARATFVERGVHHTRARTGVLVYCALAERMAVVIADAGVAAALPADTLSTWEREITRALARGGLATADAVAAICPVFAAALPRSIDDVNELHDLIDLDIDRRPRS